MVQTTHFLFVVLLIATTSNLTMTDLGTAASFHGIGRLGNGSYATDVSADESTIVFGADEAFLWTKLTARPGSDTWATVDDLCTWL